MCKLLLLFGGQQLAVRRNNRRRRRLCAAGCGGDCSRRGHCKRRARAGSGRLEKERGAVAALVLAGGRLEVAVLALHLVRLCLRRPLAAVGRLRNNN